MTYTILFKKKGKLTGIKFPKHCACYLYLSMEVFIIARAYRGHIVREWESVSAFCYRELETHEPLNAGVLMGGGGVNFYSIPVIYKCCAK